LQFKEDGQDYAVIEKMLGNGWLSVNCTDGVKRMAHIRGAFRKRVWMNVGDVILVSLRDFQDDKADVILKYTPDEARLLKSYGELPDTKEEVGEEEEEMDVEFDIDEI
jgi:translation initiation factor 1A